jgi:hypothetical protein
MLKLYHIKYEMNHVKPKTKWLNQGGPKNYSMWSN